MTAKNDRSVKTYRPSADSDDTASAIGSIEQSQQRVAREGDKPPAKEIGGRKGPEPTRFGDWEKNGRCIDF
ncbi:MAG: DUF1674 domain-containing protein [Pseudomonadota bacterium]